RFDPIPSCLARKPRAVVLRRGGQQSQEAAAHGLLGAEAAALGDPLDRQPRLREQVPGTLDPQALDRARRRQPSRLGIVPAEAALAHAGLVRQCGKREIVGQMAADPVMQRAEPVVGRLQRQDLAELRLPAGPLEKHHQIARDGKRRRAAEIILDQRQSEIDARRDAGRCPERSVAHEDRIGLDPDVGKARGELFPKSPMCHGATAVERA
ncbi:hypothetical protein chiPu_0030968, partial [Chiloscyllium punctatum]|nr:hypothetical protein [Chiloscyllium punctatum]